MPVLIVRTVYPVVPPKVEYSLTEFGLVRAEKTELKKFFQNCRELQELKLRLQTRRSL
jgi:DNA-binding HxlR family transcriptional regulator